MTPDFDAITNVILQLDVSPTAKEAGANLTENWIQSNISDADERILGVELGFVLQLEEKTFAIGVQDLISEDGEGILGSEWKTTKPQSKWWGEDKWLESISNGSQVALYACALSGATYYEENKSGCRFDVSRPRIRVRAITKSDPPVIWPTESEDGILIFSDAALHAARSAYLLKAATIRTLRQKSELPWQLPGIHCHPFNRECPLLEDGCAKQVYATGEWRFDPNDPAAKLALPHIPTPLDDPELMILSASSYGTASQCLELYRAQSIGGDGTKEDNQALQIGTVLHAGVAEFYRQIRESQRV